MKQRREEREIKNNMGRLLIFVGLVLFFALIGLLIWWVWNKVSISIQRQNSVFEIEKETHEKMKKKIQEDEE